MARAFIFVLDSFGVGGAADAAEFGDEGANTFAHIANACRANLANRPGLRSGRLNVPHMVSLGLGKAAQTSTGYEFETPPSPVLASAFFGAAQEVSSGKDTPSGHWEIAALPQHFGWGRFPDTIPAFPDALTSAMILQGQVPGILGNCHADGMAIIQQFGAQHILTGKPICYTSVDSVLQIAAHEEHFGLERLYDFCVLVRRLCDPLKIGRVIARPFSGDHPKNFRRTSNRRDYAVTPPEPTLLDRVTQAQGQVLAIGKIGDIFAHRGITRLRKAAGNMAMFDQALEAMDEAQDNDLVFANFVDFDTEYGHRRDPTGYAAALEAFDRRLPEALARLKSGDLFLLTADHGNDPTWHGTDHTREQIPIMGLAPGLAGGHVGLRSSFADIGETVAEHLGLAPGKYGNSFYTQIGGHA
ncbi:phosphopentomutase [Aquamicrobium segne]|uniref:Phosphopentomutase n=1 Tax=Aquamicrobium segne TaxID=469547 RepID=A0ABW0GTZ9_9HYPH